MKNRNVNGQANGNGARKPVDIEKMLQWCYGYELLKNRYLLPPGVLKTIYGRVERFAELGTYVDGDQPWLPAALGPPHLDALRLDAAVRSLEGGEIDCVANAEVLAGDLLVLFEATRPQTLVVYDNLDALIITHASMQTRPSWEEDAPVPTAIKNYNGTRAIIGQRYGGGRYEEGAYCPLVYEPSATAIVRSRATYAIWHSALCDLADQLEPVLSDHHALPPAATAEPWVTGAEAGEVVYEGGRLRASRQWLQPRGRDGGTARHAFLGTVRE